MTEYALLWHIHTNISIYSLNTPVGWIHLLQDILVIILQLQVAETILSLLKQKRKKKGKKEESLFYLCRGGTPGLQTELGKEFSGSTPRDQMQGV